MNAIFCVDAAAGLRMSLAIGRTICRGRQETAHGQRQSCADGTARAEAAARTCVLYPEKPRFWKRQREAQDAQTEGCKVF